MAVVGCCAGAAAAASEGAKAWRGTRRSARLDLKGTEEFNRVILRVPRVPEAPGAGVRRVRFI